MRVRADRGRPIARISRSWSRDSRVLLGAAVGMLCVAACSDAVAPRWSKVAPFAGERYDLVAIDGRPLPTTFVFDADSFVVATGSLEFASVDTLTWQLPAMTPLAAGGVPTSISASAEYRQPSRDSVEVGGLDLGPVSVSPWGYGRRRADTLTVRTADQVASNSRVQSWGFFGVHVWQFARRR